MVSVVRVKVTVWDGLTVTVAKLVYMEVLLMVAVDVLRDTVTLAEVRMLVAFPTTTAVLESLLLAVEVV